MDKQDLQQRFFELTHFLPSRSMSLELKERYCELAWSATILSAEKVGITPDGQITWEMPKRGIKEIPPLPNRLAI